MDTFPTPQIPTRNGHRKDFSRIRTSLPIPNLIDVQRVSSSYRMEQGFTFELNLAGVADEHRDAFAGTTKGEKS